MTIGQNVYHSIRSTEKNTSLAHKKQLPVAERLPIGFNLNALKGMSNVTVICQVKPWYEIELFGAKKLIKI